MRGREKNDVRVTVQLDKFTILCFSFSNERERGRERVREGVNGLWYELRCGRKDRDNVHYGASTT
jgi:hypothetical protein